MIQWFIFDDHATDEDAHIIKKNIVKSDVFTSSCTQNSFNLRFPTCTSKNVIYQIECKRCNMQYVCQTNQQVSKLMNSHRFDGYLFCSSFIIKQKY